MRQYCSDSLFRSGCHSFVNAMFGTRYFLSIAPYSVVTAHNKTQPLPSPAEVFSSDDKVIKYAGNKTLGLQRK